MSDEKDSAKPEDRKSEPVRVQCFTFSRKRKADDDKNPPKKPPPGGPKLSLNKMPVEDSETD